MRYTATLGARRRSSGGGGGTTMGSALISFLPDLPASSGFSSPQNVSTTSGLLSALSGASNGTVIYLANGTYSFADIEKKYFSPLNPVTIMSAPGAVATFTGATHGMYLGDVSGIVFKNLNFANNPNTGLKADSVVDCEFRGCTFQDNRNQGFQLGGQGSLSNATWTTGQSKRVRVDGCVIRRNGPRTGAAQQSQGFYWGANGSSTGNISSTPQGVDTFLITNSLFYDQMDGYNLQMGGSASNGIVANCTTDNIQVTGGASNTGGNIVVYTQASQGWPSNNILVVNTLVTNAHYYGVMGSGSPSAVVVRNNMGYGNNSTYGTYYLGSTGFTFTANYTDANPLYSNPTSQDYHLQSGSPARSKGDVAYMPQSDMEGNFRTVAALGCYA